MRHLGKTGIYNRNSRSNRKRNDDERSSRQLPNGRNRSRLDIRRFIFGRIVDTEERRGFIIKWYV